MNLYFILFILKKEGVWVKRLITTSNASDLGLRLKNLNIYTFDKQMLVNRTYMKILEWDWKVARAMIQSFSFFITASRYLSWMKKGNDIFGFALKVNCTDSISWNLWLLVRIARFIPKCVNMLILIEFMNYILVNN